MIVDVTNLPKGWEWPSFEPNDVIGYLVEQKERAVKSIAYRVWRAKEDLGLVPCGIGADDVAQGTWLSLLETVKSNEGKRYHALLERPIAVIFNLARYYLVRRTGKKSRLLMTTDSRRQFNFQHKLKDISLWADNNNTDENVIDNELGRDRGLTVGQDLSSAAYENLIVHQDMDSVVYEWLSNDGEMLYPLSLLRAVAEIVDARKTGYLSSASAINSALVANDGWYLMALASYHKENNSVRYSLNPSKTCIAGKWVSIGWWYFDTTDDLYHLVFDRSKIPVTAVWSRMVKREDVQVMLDNLRRVLVSKTIKVR